jgi:SAM-dependent methyltransferase
VDLHTYAILYEVEEDHWWHSSRRRLVMDQLRARYHGRAGLRLLDAGCGTGLMLQELASLGQAEGVDISEEALAFCRQRGLENVSHADVGNLPHPDSSFDVITALDVLEHMEDDVATVREFRRVLRPGGRLVLFCPAHRWLWSLQDEVSHHHRRYTRRTLGRVVTDAGLTIERLTYANAILLPPIYMGRQILKVVLRFKSLDSEASLHPSWSNGMLARIFQSEIPYLRRRDLPFGASLLCIARRDA